MPPRLEDGISVGPAGSCLRAATVVTATFVNRLIPIVIIRYAGQAYRLQFPHEEIASLSFRRSRAPLSSARTPSQSRGVKIPLNQPKQGLDGQFWTLG
jgi:hypothetical protein